MSKLNDHIVLLKLGFSSKRQHDPKGIIDLHLKHNHFKIGYAHEEVSDESIYKGIDTFSKVLGRDKSKEEHSQNLLYQKEIRDRVRHYRAMELDIQENMLKDREAKESQGGKGTSIATSSSIDKGKSPMEEIP